MFNQLKLITALSAAFITMSSLSGCTPEAPQQVAVHTPVVKIIKVTDQPHSLRRFPAQVEANKDTHLAFRVGGELKQFAVKAGAHVKQGQLLAQLDPTDFIIRLNDREARHALAKAQFERAEKLLEKKLTSQAQFDQAKANLLVAKSELKSAQTALGYTTLRASYDGVIAKVFADNLQNVSAQQVVLDMQSLDTVDIAIQVPESLVATISTEANFSPVVVFDFAPNTQYSISVKEWDAQADLLTRTYKVVFSMPSPANINVLPGMSGTVLADLNKDTDEQVFKLPVAAVFAAQDLPLNSQQRFVWQVQDDMTVKRLAVEVGEINGQGIEILGGLTGNENIVGAGVHFITQGMTVQAWVRERGL